MKVIMNKCFLLNPEKNLAQIRPVVFEKNAPLIPKNDVTEPKTRLLELPVKKLLTGYSQFQTSGNYFPKIWNWLATC